MAGMPRSRPLLHSFLGLLILLSGLSYCSKQSADTAATGGFYPAFADANVNRINDHLERATHHTGAPGGHGWVDANGDGVCDHAQDGSNVWHGPGFVDSNGNGICDYWEEGTALHNMHNGMWYQDSNRDGVNDYFQQPWHMRYGHNFIDANGDGICDYAQDGTSGGYHGPGFTDGDGDGVCDHWQTGGGGFGPMM